MQKHMLYPVETGMNPLGGLKLEFVVREGCCHSVETGMNPLGGLKQHFSLD